MSNQAKYLVRVWTKPQTQDAIKALRDAGLTVNNVDGMYKCDDHEGLLLFTALKGRNTYMIRYIHDLFGEA